jgi:hypothetical protein
MFTRKPAAPCSGDNILDAPFPWQGGQKLISLWDMKEYLASTLLKIKDTLNWSQAAAGPGKTMSATDRGRIVQKLKFVENQAAILGLVSTVRGAERLIKNCPNIPHQDVKYGVQNVIERFDDEIRDVVFLYLWPDKRRYYQESEPLGEEGKAKFPLAHVEMIDAFNCYAFERYTACVFHLMRSCEVGVKALYKTLGIATPKLADSWGNLLRPMDEELKKNPKDRCGAWAKESEFFDNATNDVRAIKRAWRDPTTHVQSTYDEQSSLKALNAVKSFFAHLSAKLNQEGEVT